MKNKHLFGIIVIVMLSLNTNRLQAQGMAVNTSGASANASAMLDVSSTTQGVLVPRMTNTQRNAISSPATGLLIYQTDGTAGFYFYSGSAWTVLGGGSPTGAAGGDLTNFYPNPTLAVSGVTPGTYGTSTQVPAYAVDAKGRIIAASNITIAGVAPGGAAGGDLIGAYPNPVIGSNKVTMAKISASGTASSSTFLRGDGSWSAAPNTHNFIHTTSSSYTVLATDDIVAYEGTLASINMALPSAASFGTGHILYIFNNTTATPSNTIHPVSGDQIADIINGGYTAAGVPSVAAGTYVILVSDGVSKWVRTN